MKKDKYNYDEKYHIKPRAYKWEQVENVLYTICCVGLAICIVLLIIYFRGR